MHKFLRAIGFSNIYKRRDMKNVLNAVLSDPSSKQYITLSDDSIAVEYRKDFGENMGIAVCGEFTDTVDFDYEFYYPYFRGNNISLTEEISIERHADKESFAGICEDDRIGVSLIFYLQNRLDYLKSQMKNASYTVNESVNLSGLALSGTIVLPLKKDQKQLQEYKRAEKDRNQMIAAARQGDESAIENLTLNDIDTYTKISSMIRKEDVFSLVDTYFMPYGIECDQYSIMGEIENIEETKNNLTNEAVYIITMNCNDLIFDICINKKDLVGEPAAGRRFKGVVWIQGFINFSQ